MKCNEKNENENDWHSVELISFTSQKHKHTEREREREVHVHLIIIESAEALIFKIWQ